MKAGIISDCLVQIYKDVHAKSVWGTMSIRDVMNGRLVKDDLRISRQNLDKITDKKEYKRVKGLVKDRLPVAVMTAVCGERGRGDVVSWRPLMILDVDYGDNKRLFDEIGVEGVKQRLFEKPFVHSVSVSCSGRGVFAVCFIDMFEDEDDYVRIFRAMDEMLEDEGIKLDEACKDVNRTRLLSYDERLLIKADDDELEAFDRRKVKESFGLEAFDFGYRGSAPSDGVSATPEFFVACAEYIRDAVDLSDYNTWFSFACYCASFPDEAAGIEAFDILSSGSAGYEGRADVERKWRQVRGKCAGTGEYAVLYGIAKRKSKNWFSEVLSMSGGAVGGGLKGLK